MKPETRYTKEVAGVVLLGNQGALLMQHRDVKPGLPYAGMWSIPSGHREPLESPEECARRELFEETGYRCANLKPLAVLTDRDDTETNYLLTVFWACYDGLQELKCNEGQALRFIERAHAASVPMPPFIISIWDQALKGVFNHGTKLK